MDYDSTVSDQWDWLRPPRPPKSATQPEHPLGAPAPPPIPGEDRSHNARVYIAEERQPTPESEAVVREAALRLAASQFDPRHISGKQLMEMLALLRNGQVITASEHDMLRHDPVTRRFPDETPDHPRDLLGDWQSRHDTDLARGDMSRLIQSAGVLSILTRLRLTRELM